MHHHHPPAQTQQRRRKKRPNYGTRTVEVRRGYNGFGFTISGQQPCRLSCIVASSPADQAGLRAGDFLISVNNLNVSKLPHETVVQLIGNSFGSIRMQIAENYFSDSSDEENALLLQSGHSALNTSGIGSAGTSTGTRQKPSYLHHKLKMHRLRNSPQKNRAKACVASVATGSVKRPESHALRPVIEDIPLMLNKLPNNNNNTLASSSSAAYNVIPKPNAIISNDISNVSAMVCVPAVAAANNACGPQHIALEYRAIVGYMGTIEMPRQISHSSKLQTVRSCIRKLRQEKRQPTTVLMTILPNCLRLQSANGNMLASYTAARLNYVSSSSESENRFFGLVTSAIHTAQADDDEEQQQHAEDDEDEDNDNNMNHIRPPQRLAANSNISISNSCHVFVIDTKLCAHQAHVQRACEFRIECTKDPIANLCLEFPNNSEYVVNLIRSMYTMRILPPATRQQPPLERAEAAQAQSPQPSNHSEVSTTTSNSDSGIGFHNDCANIADRILVVDFAGAQLLGGAPAARLARPLGIFNNYDAMALVSNSNNNCNNNNSNNDKRLTVRAMPDPKTPPQKQPPNLLASFNLIKSPATSLTATRSCDDVLSLLERAPIAGDYMLAASSSSSAAAAAGHARKSMQLSMDDISLHSTSHLYKSAVVEAAANEHLFLQPAQLALPMHKSGGGLDAAATSYSLQQECRAALQPVPNKLSPKVYGMPMAALATTAAVVVTTTTASNIVLPSLATSLSRSRRSLSSRSVRETSTDAHINDEFETWSSLQDIYSTALQSGVENSEPYGIVGLPMEATNSEPDLGNRALPSNASPFRRAWGQSSFRTPRTDKQAFGHQQPPQQLESPLVRRSASMTASDNDVYIKSMDNYIDELKQSHSRLIQPICTDPGGNKYTGSGSNNNNCIKSTTTVASATPAVRKLPTLVVHSVEPITSSTAAPTPAGPTGVAAWGTSFERLLEDPAGLHTFAEFLKKEFSAENIYFWTACERLRHLDNEAERATQAMAIFSKHLANGALEPVNVDSQARNLTAEKLQCPEQDIFAQAQKQIFNLMKFDSYQRFIRSDLYKSCLTAEQKQQALPYAAEDLDELLKTNFHQLASSKLKKSASNAEDRRRKSLLPWHRKTRCKSRDRAESDASNKLSTHTPASRLPQLSSSSLKIPSMSSTDNIHSSRSSLSSFDTIPAEEHKPCSLCRVILSDGATTIVQTRMGDTVAQLVERLLEKRGLSYQFYDVVINGCSKSIDLQSAALTLAGKEVLIEQRVAFKLDLPDPKVISVKSKPKKQLHEVIRPILQKYNYCMDAVQVLMRDTHEQLDLSLPVTVADGQRLQIVLLTATLPPFDATTTKPMLPKCIAFPAPRHTAVTAATAALRMGVNVLAPPTVPAATSTTAAPAPNPNQTTLDEITNKVFNELLQNKANGQQLPPPAVVDLCSLKSDDCTSDTSSVFDRMRRRDSNIPGMKLKPRRKLTATSSHSDETNSMPTPTAQPSAAQPSEIGSTTKKPIIAKLKAGVKLQVTERVAEHQDELLEGLKRAQLARLEDQRGTEINIELPEFLKNKENLSAANKLRKLRANLSPINRSVSLNSSEETPHSPLGERPQPAPRLSITNKNKSNNVSPMKIDEEPELQPNGNSNSTECTDYALNRGPPPLPPKPKVLPIKPSNWGVNATNTTATSASNKPAASNYVVSTVVGTAAAASNGSNHLQLSSSASKIPIDIGRKHLGAEQTGRCAYLEEPSSSFV